MNWTGSSVISIVAVAAGLWMLLFQNQFEAWQRRRYEERLVDRRARGKDAYFEELREIEAYPPETMSSPMQRVFGVLLIIIGASHFALSFTR